MNRPDLTGVPVRVTSVTSTVPLDVVTSTRRPVFVASISYFSTPPSPESTTISTRSPLIDLNVTGCLGHIEARDKFPRFGIRAGAMSPLDRIGRSGRGKGVGSPRGTQP